MAFHLYTSPTYSLRDFATWSFESSGDYDADCDFGRALARRFLTFRDYAAFDPTLGWAVGSIAKLGRPLTGIEVGFFAELSRILENAPVDERAPDLQLIESDKC